MALYFWIGIAGFFGTVTRFALTGYITSRIPAAFPAGTFAVNVTGSVLLGFLVTAGLQSFQIPPPIRMTLAVGFLGAFTTFSTWSYETLRLLESGSYLLAGLNAGGSLTMGLIGTWIGVVLGRLFS